MCVPLSLCLSVVERIAILIKRLEKKKRIYEKRVGGAQGAKMSLKKKKKKKEKEKKKKKERRAK